MRAAFLLVVLAGCDSVLHLQELPQPSPYLQCAKLSPAPMFCADFDESTLQYYATGVAMTLPVATGNVTTAQVPSTISPPNALSIDSAGDPGNSYAISTSEPSSAVTHLHATFRLAVARAPSQDATLVNLRVDNPVYQSCFTQLFIHTSGVPMPMLSLQSHCGPQSLYDYVDVFTGLPGELTTCEITFDLTTGRATLAVAGQSPAMLDLRYTSDVGGAPTAQFGLLSTGGAGPQLEFDDVIVEAD